jgi:hypothetical protein
VKCLGSFNNLAFVTLTTDHLRPARLKQASVVVCERVTKGLERYSNYSDHQTKDTRMKKCMTLLSIFFFLTLGCSNVEDPGHNRNSDMFALDIKRLVLNQVEEAKGSKYPGDEIFAVLSEFEDLESRPVGDHLGVYQELKNKLSDLHKKCESVDGRPSDLLASLQDITRLVSQLPGEVTVDKRE